MKIVNRTLFKNRMALILGITAGVIAATAGGWATLIADVVIAGALIVYAETMRAA